ncbi:MAG: hypothetical protein WC525_09760, partial [Candidatus Thermoplasmatota archaeon]
MKRRMIRHSGSFICHAGLRPASPKLQRGESGIFKIPGPSFAQAMAGRQARDDKFSPSRILRGDRFRQNLLYGLILGIAIGIAVMVFRMGVKDVQAAWSSAHIQWMKRQQLKVVNSSAGTLHQNAPIAITIDTKTLSDQHVIKSDCSDLRVTYQPDEQTSTDLTRHLVYPGNTTCSTSTA